jgi:hypothetical protein
MGQREWHRQDGETPKAFEAFCAYLHLGSQRSIDLAYQQIHGTVKKSARPRHWQEWSRQYDWVDRAAAYDLWIASQAQQQTADLTTQIVTRAKRASLKAISKVDASLDDAQEMADLTRALNSLAAAIQRLQPQDQTPTVSQIVVSFDE